MNKAAADETNKAVADATAIWMFRYVFDRSELTATLTVLPRPRSHVGRTSVSSFRSTSINPRPDGESAQSLHQYARQPAMRAHMLRDLRLLLCSAVDFCRRRHLATMRPACA